MIPTPIPGRFLLVHNASVTLGSQRGERQIPLHDFFWMCYETALEPDELMLDVQNSFFAWRNDQRLSPPSPLSATNT